MVLPGAQALLGFQVASTLTDAFSELPRSAKLIHLASFMFVAVTVILLMAPAAYHRIALQGNDSESFYKLSCRFVLLALVTLGLGLSSDLWIIVLRITGSAITATLLASLILAFFYALWFGYTFWKRANP
jgi:hypothetical protein